MKKTTDDLAAALTRILGSDGVRIKEPMSVHTSMRAGGPADYYLYVHTQKELGDVLAVLEDAGEERFILGRGTNLLVGDGGYRGAVITFGAAGARPVTDTADEIAAPGDEPAAAEGDDDPALDDIRAEENTITAGAGASLARVAMLARDHGLGGLEFAAGIPGSVGGSLVMNAGAYDGCMQQVVSSAQLLMPDGQVRWVSGEDMRFGYRRSILKQIPAIALRARLRLRACDQDSITAKMEDLAARRRARQPLEYPSAGSTFKRPEGHYAGKLIEDAGLRGYHVGGACVSEKHCGFVINKDHASAAQIRQVIEDVQWRVYEDSGVKLEREVIFLGDF